MCGSALETFLRDLKKQSDDDALLDFCRRKILHGTPYVFQGDEDAYYEFRKRLATKFGVGYRDVFITGSAKLGFSPFKMKPFDYESDINVAIVSATLYDKIMESIHDFQMALRENRKAVSDDELRRYHKFLEYGAIGWMRPDCLPSSFRVERLRRDWFDFFDSISHGRSEVGNYKVTAGVFKSSLHLERYTLSGFRSLKTTLQIGAVNASAD